MIEELFSKVKKQTSWDLSTDLTWGFFFTSATLPPLESTAAALTNHGYRFIECFQTEDAQLWLHVEKDEAHSIASITARNKELEKVAKLHKCTYDGFNVVGPEEEETPKTKKKAAVKKTKKTVAPKTKSKVVTKAKKVAPKKKAKATVKKSASKVKPKIKTKAKKKSAPAKKRSR